MKDGKQVPLRKYVYQPLDTWLARLFSRAGLEESLITQPRLPPGGIETDIWDAEAFRTFIGPDGKSYWDAPAHEYHLAFSLFINWFNPYGSRTSSRSASVGAIYMVCLNLPPMIRYHLENVYLAGIIP
ncbi:hypothetical protein OF83DRAFT_1070599, partial [Amylostereum chailletii]